MCHVSAVSRSCSPGNCFPQNLAPWRRRYGPPRFRSRLQRHVFLPTLNPFNEVAHIAVINRKAISSSDVSGQVALQSHHEVRPLPKRLYFGKPRHEINSGTSFSHIRWVEELHEFADQVRMLAIKHRITRATAAEREAISTISISGCTVAYTMMRSSTSSSSLLP